MTTPVTADDVVQGCVKYLGGVPEVVAVLGRYPFTHKPYLFQRSLWVNLENTGSTACMITRSGGWSGPNVYNTMRFPRLLMEVTADPQRDDGNVVDPTEVELRVYHAYTVIDRYLHRPQSGEQMWGTVRTIACARIAEPIIFGVPDGSGMVRLQVFYAVTEG